MLSTSLGALAKKLGTQAARLLLARLVLGAFWIGLIFTLIIYILEDDALEKWCKRSSFRLAKNSKPFEEQEELKVLHSAFSGIVMYLIEWGFWQMATESEAARKTYEAELTPNEKRQDL
jgi:phage shock protein PspC (stress-responsive transcriptional regulator)